MDIIKNKDKEFLILDFNSVMSENYHYFKNKEFWNSINFGEVRCELCNLSMDDASFIVVSIENIGEATKAIVDALVDELLSYKDRKVSKVHVMFDNYTFFYYRESKPLNSMIDSEVDKIRKSSFKTRIKNYLLKTVLDVLHEDLENTVALVGSTNKKEVVVDPFPITDVNELNSILNEYRFADSIFFDEDKVKSDKGLEHLLNWELICESGYHYNDGDFAGYTATFVSPSGTRYSFYDEMSLMGNGWELQENDMIYIS
jgi:hypothetical protein